MHLHDSLTRLPQRLHFIELLESALEAGRDGSLSVLFIDLDRFKQINDTLGYAIGDELLRAAGDRLRSLQGANDIAGRVGSDEFAVATTAAAAKYLDALRAPFRCGGSEIFVTASIGVAIFPKDGRRAAELLRNADSAMCRAKAAGGDAIELCRAGHELPESDRLRLEHALRRALENGEFEVTYQPVVNVRGTVDALEALLKWQHPVYGCIAPRRFIPIAEETGLIIPIGAWVLQQACLQGARWQHAGYRNARISVNVSARQFENRDFVEHVKSAIKASGFPPQCLALELTESYLMRNLADCVPRLHEIRALGVSISIDDFGTGYSSLSYLNKLPVDSLKIDQSFLRRLLDPDGSLPVVQSIVRLAHGMNLAVIAEGVETEAELDLVRVLGCDRVQGHIYGRAMHCDQVKELLARSGALAVVGAGG